MNPGEAYQPNQSQSLSAPASQTNSLGGGVSASATSPNLAQSGAQTPVSDLATTPAPEAPSSNVTNSAVSASPTQPSPPAGRKFKLGRWFWLPAGAILLGAAAFGGWMIWSHFSNKQIHLTTNSADYNQTALSTEDLHQLTGATQLSSINSQTIQFNGQIYILNSVGQLVLLNNILSNNTVNLQDSINGVPQSGNVIITGTLIAADLQGNGANITNLNASNLKSGTVADARLSASVTLQGNEFNGASQLVQLNGLGALPVLSGANLTNLNGSNISSGTVADARLSGDVTLIGGGATTNKITKFTGGQTIGNSSVSDDGTTVTVAANGLFQASTNSSLAFQIQNAAGTSNLLVADTVTSNIGIRETSPNYPLEVNGDVNLTTGHSLRIGGTVVCSISSCGGGAGPGFFINNQGSDGSTNIQANANFAFQSADAALVGGLIRGAAGQVEDLLQLQNSSGTALFQVGSSGITTLAASEIIQGASGLTVGTASGNTGQIVFKNSTNSNTVTLQSGVTGGGSPVFTLPTADGSSNQCLQTNGSGALAFANCVGGGGGSSGVTSVNSVVNAVVIQGTTNRVTVNTAGQNITLSTPQDIDSGASPNFSGLTLSGNAVVQGAGGLTLGTASGNTGQVVFNNSGNSNAVTLKSGTSGSNFSLTLPTSAGSANQCLQTNGSGVLTFANCVGGGGGSSGVTDVNGITNSVGINGTANEVIVNSSSPTITLSTPQRIDTGFAPTFAGLTINGTGAFTTAVTTPILQSAAALQITPGGSSSLTIGGAGNQFTLQGSTGSTINVNSQAFAFGAGGQICTSTASTCNTTYQVAGSYINLQGSTPGSAQTGNLNISGTGIFGTAIQAPLLDTSSGVALNLGTTNATAINLNQNVVIAAGKNLTFAGATGNFDQSASSGTFTTGTGAVTLKGLTAVRTTANASSFQIQNAAGSQALLNFDTTVQSGNLISTANSVLDSGTGVSTGTCAGSCTWALKGSDATPTVINTQNFNSGGNQSLQVTTTAAAGDGALLSASLSASTPYVLSMYIKAGSTLSDVVVGYQSSAGGSGNDTTNCVAQQTVLSTGWTQFICSFTTAGSVSSPNIYVKKTGTSAETFFIDQVELYDTSGSKLTLGNNASALSGQLSLVSSGVSGGGSITLQAAPSIQGNYVLTVPGQSGTLCTDNPTSNCSITNDGKYLSKTSQDIALASVQPANFSPFSSGFLYDFINSNSAASSGVLELSNGTNTASTLYVTTAGNIQSGSALIRGVNSNASPSGALLSLESGSGTPTQVFRVGSTGVTTISPSADSNILFQVQNAATAAILNVSSTTNITTAKGTLSVLSINSPPTISVAAGSASGGNFDWNNGTGTYFYEVTGVDGGGHQSNASNEPAGFSAASFGKLANPGNAPTLAEVATLSPGCLNGGFSHTNYRYEIAWVTPYGTTLVGPSASINVTGPSTDCVRVTFNNTVPDGTTLVGVYRSNNGDAFTLITSGSLCATGVSEPGTSACTDSIGSRSGAVPGSNTAHTTTNNINVTISNDNIATSYNVYRGVSSGTEQFVTNTAATGGANTVFADTGTAASGSGPGAANNYFLGVGTNAPSANLDVIGTAIFQPVSDQANAFQIQNAGGTSLFNVNTNTSAVNFANGANIINTGTYNTNTFTSSGLTFGAASTATIQPAASQALTITGHGNSTWSTNSGTLTIQGAGGLTLNTPSISGGTSAINIKSGNSSSNIAGDINLQPGSSVLANNTGGNIGLTGGSISSATSTGGAITLIGGGASGASSVGGQVKLQGGNATSASCISGNGCVGGSVVIQGGNATSASGLSSNGGGIFIDGGNAVGIGPTKGVINIGHTDITGAPDNASQVLVGNTSAPTNLYGSTIELAANGPINVGTTSATGVSIGNTSAPVLIQGNNAAGAVAIQAAGSSATILIATTQSVAVTIGKAGGTGTLVVNGNTTFNGTLTFNGHIISGNTSGSTTVAAGAAACTLPTVTLVAGSNDTAGTISVVAGTSCTGTAGTVATVSFNVSTPYTQAPRVILTPANAKAASVHYSNNTTTTTTFTLNSSDDLTDSQTYLYNYLVVQ